MSGGHWDYSSERIREVLNCVGGDNEVKKRFPKISRVYLAMADILADAEHTMDWDLSSDSSIENDKKFEDRFMLKVQKAIGKVIPYAEMDIKLQKMKDILDSEEGK